MIAKVKEKHYVDNVKFYEAMVEYKIITDASYEIYRKKLLKWKISCIKIAKNIKKNNPPLYKELLKEKKFWRKRIACTDEMEIKYNIPKKPLYINPKIPEYIGSCIYLIGMKFSNYWKFHRYSYKEDLAADGIEDCILRIRSFDPKKSKNPFAYFTQVCYFAAIRRINKEKKQKAIKSAIIKNSGIIDDISHTVQFGDDTDYQNAYLQFLLENIDENDEEENKKEAQKFKRTTLAHKKRMEEKEKSIVITNN